MACDHIALVLMFSKIGITETDASFSNDFAPPRLGLASFMLQDLN